MNYERITRISFYWASYLNLERFFIQKLQKEKSCLSAVYVVICISLLQAQGKASIFLLNGGHQRK